MKENRKIAGPYVRNGIIIGLFFPLLSYVLCLMVLVPENYPFSLSTLHSDFPLLWVIDLAPLVLGLISFFVGTSVNRSISQKNKLLNKLVSEKEVLLKEIHHRVKNNLQVITSLLSLQSSFIDGENTKALFRYSQYRINSMAMIHEMLYKSHNISNINYGEYVHKLISELITSMKGSGHGVNLTVNVEEIHLNIDTAIPLGLLINEIATNALKYGLKNDDGNNLYIEIKKVKHNTFKMLMGDNGDGFSDKINFRSSNTLGLILIHKLSLQLQGSIEKDNNIKGTNYILTFQEIEQTS